MSRPVVVIGAGGHCRVLLDALKLLGRKVYGICDKDASKAGDRIAGVLILGTDEEVTRFSCDAVELVNAVGSIGPTAARASIYKRFSRMGYRFATLVHPAAVIASDARLGEGVQVMAGAILQSGAVVGENSIINTKASVDHDCVVGSNVHLAPGVTLSGNVTVGDGVHLGTGASAVQGVSIGCNSVIGAGAVVLTDVTEAVLAYGVPARQIKTI